MERFDVIIRASGVEQLRALDEYDVDIHHKAATMEDRDIFAVPGILSKVEIKTLTAAGYDVKIVRDLTLVSRERQAQVSSVNRFLEVPAGTLDASLTVQGYLTNDEIDAAIESIVTAHPDVASKVDLPYATWENRRSTAVRLRAGRRTNRVGVLFTGSMHAREWGGSDICIAFMLQIINAYKSNTPLQFGGKQFSAGQVKTILEELDVFVFPNVNPDGKNYSQTQDIWWRKNRNPNGSGPAGVDINRNFDFLWSSGIGTSTSKSSLTYRGTAPFSEPESKNVKHIFDTFPFIRYYLDIHSYSGLVLYSWGDDDNQDGTPAQNFLNTSYDGVRGVAGDAVYREFTPSLEQNTLRGLSTRMHDALQAVRGQNYTVDQSVGLYPTSATSNDYAVSRVYAPPVRPQVYGFTIEFGAEFIPPIAEMNLIKQDIGAAMSELCWSACSDVYIADNAADPGSVPSTSPFWDSPDIWVRNRNDSGTVHQDTIRGVDNFVLLRVHNRGSAEARNLVVRVYITTWAGTEFVYPADWVPRNPAGGGTIAAQGTYLIGQTAVSSLSPQSSQVVTMRWPAGLIPNDSAWHPCLLAEVSPNDGPPSSGAHVWDNNNLAQKNISIVNARAQRKLTFPFAIGSAFSKGGRCSVECRKIRCPAEVGIMLTFGMRVKISPDGIYQFVAVRGRESRTFRLPPRVNLGRLTFAAPAGKRLPTTLVLDNLPVGAVHGPYVFEIIQNNEWGRPVGGLVLQIENRRVIKPVTRPPRSIALGRQPGASGVKGRAKQAPARSKHTHR